jgi:hypothetical protein
MEITKFNLFMPRCLGDIVIAIPIAGYYRDMGLTVTWPIDQPFYPTAKAAAPWVNWVPYKHEASFPGETNVELYDRIGLPGFFYEPGAIVAQIFNVQEELDETDMHLKFDQFRYAKACVPFLFKWKLSDYVTRYPDQEAELKAKVVKSDRYIVTHTKGSTANLTLNTSDLEAQGFQIIEITPGLTDNAFNWLGVIEGASHCHMFDSSFANIIDQMQLTVPKTFYRRSLWKMTPVMAMNWDFGPAPNDIIEQIKADHVRRGVNPEESKEFEDVYTTVQRERINFMRRTMRYKV